MEGVISKSDNVLNLELSSNTMEVAFHPLSYCKTEKCIILEQSVTRLTGDNITSEY